MDKIAQLGKPSLVFGPGQQKRLDLVKKFVCLEGRKILDIGCGIGAYTGKFKELSLETYGTDVDKETIDRAKKLNPDINFVVSPAETQPFEDNFFDVVFLHEVLEHVSDDKKTAAESLRVLKPQGQIVIFVPNKLYPFETHGVYVFGKYIYKLIPFVNWLPKKIRNFFCPHVRVYNVSDLKKLFNTFETLSFVYPALDKITARRPNLGKTMKKFCNFAEKNHFLKRFGISIFAVVRKK